LNHPGFPIREFLWGLGPACYPVAPGVLDVLPDAGRYAVLLGNNIGRFLFDWGVLLVGGAVWFGGITPYPGERYLLSRESESVVCFPIGSM